MNSNVKKRDFDSVNIDIDGELAPSSVFIFDKDHRVEKFKDAAIAILTCLKTNGPIESLKYLSDPTKEFSAEYTTKKSRKRGETLSAILFTL